MEELDADELKRLEAALKKFVAKNGKTEPEKGPEPEVDDGIPFEPDKPNITQEQGTEIAELLKTTKYKNPENADFLEQVGVGVTKVKIDSIWQLTKEEADKVIAGLKASIKRSKGA